MMLVDSHCHLDSPDFAAEVEAVVERAGAAGVGLMLTIGTRVTRFDGVLALAERFPNVYCTVGIHPHEADTEPETDAARLVELARHPKVVGFGETGLDYFYEHSGREAQVKAFRAHIQAARQTGLPVVIHTRNADDDTVAILDEEMGQGAFTGVIHCFSSGQAVADAAVRHGLFLSLSGIITFKAADALRETIRTIPPSLMLVETDAPFLAPIPKRGKRNEPAFVGHTAAKLAEITGLSTAAVEQTTTANFHRLFTKVPPP